MATANNCSTLDQDTAVCKFYKKLKSDHAEQEVKLKVSETKIDALEIEREYAICELAMTDETFAYYRDFNNYELADMKGSAAIIQANIDTYIAADTELGNKIKEVSTSLNDLQVKLHSANNAACAMHNCLQSLLDFDDDCIPEELKEVVDCAKDLSDASKDAADGMINTAGIHTFSNIETLKPFATELTEKFAGLETYTDALITTASTQQVEAQSKLDDVITRLTQEDFEFFSFSSNANAYKCIKSFICNEERKCPHIGDIKEICKELGNYDDSSPEPCFTQDNED